MHIIMATPEVAPYSKTGGLADVSGALQKELAKIGHKVKVFSPFYRCVRDGAHKTRDTGIRVNLSIGGADMEAGIWQDGDFYFVREDSFFCREDLYGHGAKDYEDNPLRFTFFSLAILEALKEMGEKVDIIHCHDWQTGLIPLYLKNTYRDVAGLRQTASIFTIHNLAYQGLFPKETMESIGLPRELFNSKELEFYDQLSFIKGGLVFADILTTVSKRYSREIQEEGTGCGLEGLLKERAKDLYGIVNGVDFDAWNPETDPYIPSNYSAGNLSGKGVCKKALKKEFNLPDRGDIPLIGMVSRLDPQKGFDIIEAAGEALCRLPAQFVFLGSGYDRISDFLKGLKKKHPDRVGVYIGYDERLAHLIEAGSDIYLMPSRYEPCGLNHLYSLRYGTIPVVRGTGGLDDTIVNYNGKNGHGNGFKFRNFTARAMIGALKKAVHLYRSNRKEWQKLQQSGMAEDHSWTKSVISYDKLYKKVAGKKSGLSLNRGKQP